MYVKREKGKIDNIDEISIYNLGPKDLYTYSEKRFNVTPTCLQKCYKNNTPQYKYFKTL